MLTSSRHVQWDKDPVVHLAKGITFTSVTNNNQVHKAQYCFNRSWNLPTSWNRNVHYYIHKSQPVDSILLLNALHPHLMILDLSIKMSKTYRNTILSWDNLTETKRLNNMWMNNSKQWILNEGSAADSNYTHTAHCFPLQWEWDTHLGLRFRKILNGRNLRQRLMSWEHRHKPLKTGRFSFSEH
jgi:hypothetical protein